MCLCEQFLGSVGFLISLLQHPGVFHPVPFVYWGQTNKNKAGLKWKFSLFLSSVKERINKWRNSWKDRCTTSCDYYINSLLFFVLISLSLPPSHFHSLSFHLFTPDVCLNLSRISAGRKDLDTKRWSENTLSLLAPKLKRNRSPLTTADRIRSFWAHTAL